MAVERECDLHTSRSHNDEGNRVHQAEVLRASLEQAAEAGVVERGVYPDHLEEGNQVFVESADGVAADPAPEERRSLDQHVGRRQKPSRGAREALEGPPRVLVPGVRRDEKREDGGGVDENGAQSSVSSR